MFLFVGVGVVVVGEYLFVIGGFDDFFFLDLVERYDLYINQWTYVVNMITCRGGVGIGVMGGRLWVVGGYNGEYYLNSVEIYDFLIDTWEEVVYMYEFRVGCGVVGSFCDVEDLRNAFDLSN